MAQVVRARLREADAQEGYLLDGYPRTIPQAETLEEILREGGKRLDAVVLLEVPEDELVRRALGRGREDDREEVARERFRVYREKTEPLVAFYRNSGLLQVVDGNRPIDEVTQGILGSLGVSP
jgi:adenylate kinase